MDNEEKGWKAARSLSAHLVEQGIRNTGVTPQGTGTENARWSDETYLSVRTYDDSQWKQIPKRWEGFSVEPSDGL